MQFQFSAGGVVYDQRQVNNNEPKIFVLLCQHSYHHGWGFPKGLIGDKIEGEGKEETAIREVEEETGAKGKIVGEVAPVTYWYKFKEEKIKKTVYFYVMQYLGGDITKHDFEMEDVQWIEQDKVLEKLTFKSDKEVFRQALPIIQEIIDKRQ